MTYSPVHVHSAFSFLDGASSVDALVLRAAELELPALALTDTGSVIGIVSLTQKCRKVGIKPLGGCEVVVAGLGRLTLLADGPTGWGVPVPTADNRLTPRCEARTGQGRRGGRDLGRPRSRA